MKKGGVFIDRDGVINHDPGNFYKIQDLKIFSGVVKAVGLLNKHNIPAVVVTNQGVVAKGLITEEGVIEIHNKIQTILSEKGAKIDKFYYCPHHPDGVVQKYSIICNCRKPATGMFEAAAKEFNLDFKKSYVIGDSFREIEVAKTLGCKSIAVECGASVFRNSTPDYRVKDLYEAVKLILTSL